MYWIEISETCRPNSKIKAQTMTNMTFPLQIQGDFVFSSLVVFCRSRLIPMGYFGWESCVQREHSMLPISWFALVFKAAGRISGTTINTTKIPKANKIIEPNTGIQGLRDARAAPTGTAINTATRPATWTWENAVDLVRWQVKSCYTSLGIVHISHLISAGHTSAIMAKVMEDNDAPPPPINCQRPEIHTARSEKIWGNQAANQTLAVFIC